LPQEKSPSETSISLKIESQASKRAPQSSILSSLELKIPENNLKERSMKNSLSTFSPKKKESQKIRIPPPTFED